MLGVEVWKYIKAGADKNARDNLLKAYDLVPLHDNLKKIVVKKDRTKRQCTAKKIPDLSPLAGMKFGGAPPEFSESEEVDSW